MAATPDGQFLIKLPAAPGSGKRHPGAGTGLIALGIVIGAIIRSLIALRAVARRRRA